MGSCITSTGSYILSVAVPSAWEVSGLFQMLINPKTGSTSLSSPPTLPHTAADWKEQNSPSIPPRSPTSAGAECVTWQYLQPPSVCGRCADAPQWGSEHFHKGARREAKCQHTFVFRRAIKRKNVRLWREQQWSVTMVSPGLGAFLRPTGKLERTDRPLTNGRTGWSVAL